MKTHYAYHCKNPKCNLDHMIPGAIDPDKHVLIANWPQRFQCPQNGIYYEYWKDDIGMMSVPDEYSH
jgi:hydroxypyruvate isomerase